METIERLMKRLDRLCKRDRDRAIVEWRRQADSAEVSSALEVLFQGDAWMRGVGVFVAALAGREPHVVAAMADRSLQVRRIALAQVASRCRDVARVVAAARVSAPATRRELAEKVSRLRRADLAQPLAEAFVTQRDFLAARPLLEWCDEALLRRTIDDRGYRAVRWARTAARRPEVALGMLRAELERATSQTAVAWAWGPFASAMPTLAKSHPAALLDLWERLGPRDWLPSVFSGCWPDLLRADPGRAVALACRALTASPTTPPPRALLRAARSLPAPSLELLARTVAANRTHLAALLAALPPARREETFAAAVRDLDTANEVWPDAVLGALPHARRHAEVRRMLALPAVQRDPAQALALTRWLPVEEAQPRLAQQAKSSKGEDRARGWTLRIENAASNRRGFGDTLKALLILKNEQDPVRLAAYEALRRVPVSLFEPAHADALLALTDFAVNARDTSYATRSALQALAHRLMVAWAHEPQAALFEASLRMLLKLAEHRPTLSFPRLAEIRRGAEKRVVERLVPWFKAEVARELNLNVINLANALGRRAWALPELQAMLKEIAFTARKAAHGERGAAANLWVDAPGTRDQRVRALLDLDESAAILPRVWWHLHRNRQDWLDPFIRGRVLAGAFGSDKAGWLFPATSGFERWLPRQQRAFAKTVGKVVHDKGHHTTTRGALAARLAALPVTSVAELEPLTRSEAVPIAEGALGALVWLDEPGPAMPILLDHLDSDRARVAMYALPRLARLVPDLELLATLRALLAREKLKVTVHKEALRLLGGLQLPGVDELLEAQWARPDQHRDVRVALLHAARRRLDAKSSWVMLEAASAHPDRDLAHTLLEAIEAEVPPRHRDRYAQYVLALGRHPSREVQQALLQHLAQPVSWGRHAPDKAFRVAEHLWSVAAGPGAPWPEAALAVAALAACPAGLETLPQAVGGDDEGLPTSPGEEDLPRQRRTEALCAALLAVPPGDRARTAPVRACVVRGLAGAPWSWAERVALVLVDLPLSLGTEAALRALADEASSQLQAFELGQAVRRWAMDRTRECSQGLLIQLAEKLVGGSGRPQWIGLALVQAAGERFGWSAEARKLLAAFRRDPETAAHARKIRADAGVQSS